MNDRNKPECKKLTLPRTDDRQSPYRTTPWKRATSEPLQEDGRGHSTPPPIISADIEEIQTAFMEALLADTIITEAIVRRPALNSEIAEAISKISKAIYRAQTEISLENAKENIELAIERHTGFIPEMLLTDFQRQFSKIIKATVNSLAESPFFDIN